MIDSSYTSFNNIINEFTRSAGSAERVLSIMNNKPIIEPNKGEKVDEVEGEFTMEGVEFHYQMRPEEKVLKGLNLKIEAGKVCALVGKSGGGKSTCLHLLMRFYDPKVGCIRLDGRDLRTIDPLSLRKHMGLVAQDTQLFNSTIEENITFGVNSYTQEDLVEASKLANAHEFITTLEDGYKTKVGECGARLSGGQKQRIALARCFMKRPSILFLDEATSSLDAESESLVQEAIDRLIQIRKCTVILVAHRLSTVINANSIAVIDNGIVAEQGNHEELVSKGGIYAKLVSKQLQKMNNSLLVDKKEGESNDTIDSLLEMNEVKTEEETETTN